MFDLSHIHLMQSSNISYRIYCNFHAVNAWIIESYSGQLAKKYQLNQFNLFNYIELGFEFEYASKYPPDTNISDSCLSYHFLTLCANALDSHRNKEFLITFCNILRLDPLFNWIKSPHQNAECCCRFLLFAVYLKINKKKSTLRIKWNKSKKMISLWPVYEMKNTFQINAEQQQRRQQQQQPNIKHILFHIICRIKVNTVRLLIDSYVCTWHFHFGS